MFGQILVFNFLKFCVIISVNGLDQISVLHFLFHNFWNKVLYVVAKYRKIEKKGSFLTKLQGARENVSFIKKRKEKKLKIMHKIIFFYEFL